MSHSATSDVGSTAGSGLSDPMIGVINSSPAELGYTLPLQTVQIQISWLLKKPTDLDLHCLPLSMCLYMYQQSGSSNLIG